MLLVVRSHMGKGVEEWVRLEGGFSLCCEQLWEGSLLGRGILPAATPSSLPAVGCFCRWDWFGAGTGRPRSPPPPPRPPEAFLPSLAPSRRCSRFSRCFYDYIVCVGGSDVGGCPREGRSWAIIYQCHPHNDSLCSLLLMRIITLAQSD